MNSINRLIIKSILIYLFFISICKCDDWMELIKKEVEQLKTPFPSDGDRLVFWVNSSGDITTQYFPIDEMEEAFEENEFSEELKNKIRSIIWTNSITFQSFSYNQFIGLSILVETAGVARKLDNEVDLFFFTSHTIASLRPQYNIVKKKECSTFLYLFDIYCWYEDKLIPRAHTIQEINTIQDALRSKAYEALYDGLNNHQPPALYLVDSEIHQSQNASTFDKEIEKVMQENEEKINMILEVYNDDKYIKLLPSNANDFKKAIEENNFFSISPRSLEMFFDIFVNNISKSMNDKFSKYLKMFLKSLISKKISNIASLKFFVTNLDSNLDLYEVFLNYNEKDNQYSIRVRYMKTEIKLESTVLITKLNSEDVISIFQNQEDDDDLTLHLSPLINLYEVVCQNI